MSQELPLQNDLSVLISNGNISAAITVGQGRDDSFWQSEALTKCLAQGLINNPNDVLDAYVKQSLPLTTKETVDAYRSALITSLKDAPFYPGPYTDDYLYVRLLRAVKSRIDEPLEQDPTRRSDLYEFRHATFVITETFYAIGELSQGDMSAALNILNGKMDQCVLEGSLAPYAERLPKFLQELLEKEGVTTIEGLREWIETKIEMARKSTIEGKPSNSQAEDQEHQESTTLPPELPELERIPPGKFGRILFPHLSSNDTAIEAWTDNVERALEVRLRNEQQQVDRAQRSEMLLRGEQELLRLHEESLGIRDISNELELDR